MVVKFISKLFIRIWLRFFLKTLIVSIVVFVSPPSFAQWRSSAYQRAQFFEEFPSDPQQSVHEFVHELNVQERSFLATWWGGAQRALADSKAWSAYLIDFQSVYFEKALKVYLHKHKEIVAAQRVSARRSRRVEAQRIARAPLLVFVPGIFSNADGAAPRLITKIFAKLGYHVLILPNSWSPDYLSAQKKKTDGDGFRQDAELVLELTKNVIQNEIGENLVTEVHLMGESLGAGIASVVYALDLNSKVPVFDAGLTMMWPPANIAQSVDILDRYLFQYDEEVFEQRCREHVIHGSTVLRALFGSLLSRPKLMDVECAGPAIMNLGFRKRLNSNAEFFENNNKNNNDNKVHNNARNFGHRVKFDKMNFQTYLANYFPKFKNRVDSNDDYLSLERLIKRFYVSRQTNFRIITSEDDFINQPNVYLDMVNRGVFASDHIIQLKWGGHVGVTFTDSFIEILRHQFKR